MTTFKKMPFHEYEKIIAETHAQELGEIVAQDFLNQLNNTLQLVDDIEVKTYIIFSALSKIIACIFASIVKPTKYNESIEMLNGLIDNALKIINRKE